MKIIYIFMTILVIVSVILFILWKKAHNKSKSSTIRQNYRKNMEQTEEKRMQSMNHKNDEPYINFSYHYQLMLLLEDLVKFFEDNGIEYIVTGGFLLGHQRHNGGFIPWDDDIDVAIMSKDEHKIKHFPKKLFDIYKWPTTYNGDNSGPFVDIFIINEDTMKYKHGIFPKENFTDILYPIRKEKFVLYGPDGNVFKEMLLNVPNDIQEYLKRSYGENVMTEFLCKKQNQHVNFYHDMYEKYQYLPYFYY
jgi:hypothetical protein